MTTLHPAVERLGKEFRVVGMSTPSAVARKARLILSPGFVGERVVLVVADAVRCSTTILATLAAGAAAMTISEKNGRGPSPAEAEEVAAALGLDSVLAGELHGQPIPGGVLGNSPREVRPAAVAGKLVAFHSTNFGAAFWEAAAWAAEFEARGGEPTLAVASFANTPAVSRWLRRRHFHRIGIATGGFYDVVSHEDVVVAGDVIADLRLPQEDLDDEARVMVGAASALPASRDRLASFTTNWIGRSLHHFGMLDDVAAAVAGTGMAPSLWSAMRRLVPVVVRIGSIPVIVPAGRLPQELRPVSHQPLPQEKAR
jgi:phosphosulfolactate phosphohydrolase-like enzyme